MKYIIKELQDEDESPYVEGFENRDSVWSYSGDVKDAYRFDSVDEAIARIVKRAESGGPMRNGFTVKGVEEVVTTKLVLKEVTL